MHNSITVRLADLVKNDSASAIQAVSSTIESGSASPIICAELLKELGNIRDAASHRSRRWVLERALFSPSVFVRDGAGLGLARLGDPDALQYLRRALTNEHNSDARADLALVIKELDEIVGDGSPSSNSQ